MAVSYISTYRHYSGWLPEIKWNPLLITLYPTQTTFISSHLEPIMSPSARCNSFKLGTFLLCAGPQHTNCWQNYNPSKATNLEHDEAFWISGCKRELGQTAAQTQAWPRTDGSEGECVHQFKHDLYSLTALFLLLVGVIWAVSCFSWFIHHHDNLCCLPCISSNKWSSKSTRSHNAACYSLCNGE